MVEFSVYIDTLNILANKKRERTLYYKELFSAAPY